MDGLGHPIEGHIGEQFVFAESAFHVAVAVRGCVAPAGADLDVCATVIA